MRRQRDTNETCGHDAEIRLHEIIRIRCKEADSVAFLKAEARKRGADGRGILLKPGKCIGLAVVSDRGSIRKFSEAFCPHFGD